MPRSRYHGYVIVASWKIRRARREQFKTQADLAKEASISAATVTKIECKWNYYTQIKTARKIAKALGLDVSEIIDSNAMVDYYAEDESLEEPLTLADL